jgi:predicted nucleic acid-binding protein
MTLLLWDASGLVKRYTAEAGGDTVDALFTHVAPTDMATTPWGYVESYSILLRRYNAGVIDLDAFNNAEALLRTEVGAGSDFGMLSVTDEMIFAGLAIMRKHNLNSTDAAILTLFLSSVPSPPPPDCVLVASDKRLLRAADAEGFKTLNPELMPAADVPAFLASL